MKMCKNLEIYNKYRTVPSDAIKPFDNGKFKGTDINTMWRVKCLTECFGVCGFGWTFKVLRTWTENGANDEVMAFAEVEMKVKLNGEWSEPFTATGGNLMVRYVKGKNGNQGYYTNNDEAFKMAITDAFGVACKYLGIGADVYWANDHTKYTDTGENLNENTSGNSNKKAKAEQTPKNNQNEPKKAVIEPQTPTMTYEQALEVVHEGRTLKEIYKTERQYIPHVFETGTNEVKQAISIIEAYLQSLKANK